MWQAWLQEAQRADAAVDIELRKSCSPRREHVAAKSFKLRFVACVNAAPGCKKGEV
jgi:hypothetical protein